MKNNITRLLIGMIALACSAALFFSCSDDDNAPPVLDHVSIVPKDSVLQSGARGQMVVIFGSNLASTKAVYFNGYPATFNPTFVRNDNIILTIPADAPYANVDNTIRVVTEHGEATLSFVVTQAPVINSFTGVAENGATITIDGDYFDNLVSVAFVNAGTTDTLYADIVSADPKEIQVVVPDGTKVSYIVVKTALGTTVSSSTFGLNYIIYADKFNSSWDNWSWSSEWDYSSTTVVKTGEYSYKQTFTGSWGGVQLHTADISLSGYTAIKFAVYGGPGTTGKVLNMNINWGTTYTVTLTEGAWVVYTIPLSTWGSPSTLSFVVFQDNGSTSPSAPYLFYIDDMGLL
ncbi:MAG TPA: IPT/TIG domain-containing protein [Ohtaekwangia sp.]|uniref:IPT/TIG domain-containing protein n=1 Tax=Ohtaekwangia sp. TaxID=2066019 RepID=UPI002F91E824